MFNRSNTTSRGPLYDDASVQPMRDELTYVGFEELLTPEDVERALAGDEGTTLVMLNSVCGCAAGSARPAVTEALQHSVIPDSLVTVFAGMEREAVDRMRAAFTDYAPSSPNIALLKDGAVVLMLQRHDIEGRSAEELAEKLSAAFDKHCRRPAPSIPADKYEALVHARVCGSTIPRG